MLRLGALLLLSVTGPGPGWQELKSAHFTLRTNLEPEAAMTAAREIERTRAALLAAMWPAPHEAGIEPVDIIVLKDRADFERYSAPGSRGLYSHSALPPRIVLWGAPSSWEEKLSELSPSGIPAARSPATSQPLPGPSRHGAGYVSMPAPSSSQRPQPVDGELAAHVELVRQGSASVLRHELAHHVASAVYGRLPLWFSEGQAQFLESLRLSEDGRSATVGLLNPAAWLEFRRIRAMTTLDVLRWNTPLSGLSQGDSMGLYGASWQLYEWLFTAHREGLRCYQEGLASQEASAAAWARCFSALEPKELDRLLWDFSRTGKPALLELSVPPVGFEVNIRPLTEAEFHLVRAQVALAAPRTQELIAEAQTEVERALAADPASVGALQLLAPLVSPQTRLDNGRRAVVAHPDDGWAWLLLADALWDTGGPAGERYRAYQRAVRLLPDSPLALGRAARNLLSRDERPEALVLAERAAQLAPWNGEVLAIHALALAAAGRCAEGTSAAELARRMLPSGSTGFTVALDVGLARACPGESPADAGVTTGQR
jgi:tetratricopeptide (TPR) repeat protein